MIKRANLITFQKGGEICDPELQFPRRARVSLITQDTVSPGEIGVKT